MVGSGFRMSAIPRYNAFFKKNKNNFGTNDKENTLFEAKYIHFQKILLQVSHKQSVIIDRINFSKVRSTT